MSVNEFTISPPDKLSFRGSPDTQIRFNAETTTLLSDALFRVFNDIDHTRILRISSSGITTGTTRVLSAPDSDGVIALYQAPVASIGLNEKTDSQKITDIITALRTHGILGPNA